MFAFEYQVQFSNFSIRAHSSWTWTMETRVTPRSLSTVWWVCRCQPTLITDQQWVTTSAQISTDNCSYYYTSPSCTDTEREPINIQGREAYKHASSSTEAHHPSFEITNKCHSLPEPQPGASTRSRTYKHICIPHRHKQTILRKSQQTNPRISSPLEPRC